MRYRCSKKAALLFLWVCLNLLFSFSTVEAQEKSTYVHSGFILEHWGVEDGLPVNSVNKVIQTSSGYLWLATTDGLVRFDGVNFTIFKTWQYPGLPSNRIDGIKEASDSTIWLETEQQHLVKFDGRRFTHITSSKNFNGNLVNKLYLDDSERLWIGTDEGLNLYQNGELSAFHPDEISGGIDRIFLQDDETLWLRNGTTRNILKFTKSKGVEKIARAEAEDDANAIFEDDRQNTWFSTQKGIYKYHQDSLQFYPTRHEVIDITQHADTLWFATDGGGFMYRANGEFHQTDQGKQDEVLLSNSFLRDKQGRFWKATGNDIYRGDELILEMPNTINILQFDNEGSLWFGTFNAGLYRLKPNLFSVVTAREGLPMNIVYPVIEDADKNLWVGTHGQGVARIKKGKGFAGYNFKDWNSDIFVRSLWQRKDGRLLAGIIDGGVYQLDEKSNTFVPYPSPDELQSVWATAIYEDSQNRLFVASGAGLFMQQQGSWRKFDNTEHPNLDLIRTVAEAPDGDLWFGTNGAGIIRYDGQEFISFTEEEGLSTNLIRSIFIEENGEGYSLWIGTEDRGLTHLKWDEQQQKIVDIQNIDRSDGLFDNVIHTIIDDGDGKFWMSSNRGIFWVRKTQLEAFVAEKSAEVNSTGYNEKDGMPNREANGGVFPAGWQSDDGRLWFPTQDGVVAIDPEEVRRNEIPPKIKIEQLTADTSVFKDPGRVNLEADQRDISIKYTGLSFWVPRKVQFRYRIKELTEKWTETGTRREAFYTNLPPGDFTFQVTAANNDGIWNDNPAELAISVAPYFYETNWFYLICVLFLVGLGFGTVKWRTYRLKIAERKLKREVNARTGELRKEKRKTERQAKQLKELDKAKSKFFANISHEFRTPLTLILNPIQQILDEGDYRSESEKEKLRLVLRNGQRLMRLINQILDIIKLETGNMKLDLQPIPMAKFAKETLEMFKPIADQQNIKLHFSSDVSRQTVMADHQKMEQVLGNLIANAIKFTPQNGRVSVSVDGHDGQILVAVEDTGIGIPEEKRNKIFDRFYQVDESDTRAAEGMGIGLALCKEIVEMHDGTLEITSDEGDGTCFTMSLVKARDIVDQRSEQNGIRADEYLADATEGNQSLAETPPKQPGYQRPEERTNILVVEDNEDMRLHIQSVLEDEYFVITAVDGEEALQKVENAPPDLIIADVMMPEMDGMTFNKKLKGNILWQNIPLIFLTARATDSDKISALQDGGDIYLTKPFNPDVLVSHIDNLLVSRQRLRQKFMTEPTGKTHSENHSFIGRINAKLDEKFADPDFGVDELAEELNQSRSQLYRKVKKKTESTPVQLLSDYRLNKAKELLAKGEQNISEVAYGTGFNSLSYFSRRFREKFGVAPSEIRE